MLLTITVLINGNGNFNGKRIKWKNDNETDVKNLKTFQKKSSYNGKTETSKQKLMFNITCYLNFQYVRNILQELHLLLASDKEHERVFPDDFIMVRVLKSIRLKYVSHARREPV